MFWGMAKGGAGIVKLLNYVCTTIKVFSDFLYFYTSEKPEQS